MPPNQSSLSATVFSNKITRLLISGAWNAAVKEYSEWQQSQEDNELRKAEYQKACDIALDNGFDLDKIHQKLDPGCIAHLLNQLRMMERGVIHDKNRPRLWPSAAMTKKLLNEIFKYFAVSRTLVYPREKNSILCKSG